jgi:hypothetical protein
VGEFPRFISDEELIVLGDPDDDLQLRAWEYVPMYTLNTSTGEKTDLPPLPHIEFLSFYFTQQGNHYAVYDAFSHHPHGYYLFDYSSNVSSPIFQWLDHIEGWYPLTPSPHRRHDGSFMVTVGRSYGFDIGADLTLDQVLGETSYEAVMRPVILPGGDSTALISLVHEDAPTDNLPVFRRDTDTGGQSFYMFNYHNMVLLDYCLEPLLEGALYVAHDGRYLAGTLTRLIEGEFPDYQPYAAFILDIESGHYAAIEGFVSLGWVERD